MTFLRVVLFAASLAVYSNSSAQSLSDRLQDVFGTPTGGDEILHPDDAFILSAEPTDSHTILAAWQIAEGYYLYRDKFKFAIKEGPASLNDSEILIPKGKIKEDPAFGRVEVNIGDIEVRLPLNRPSMEEASIVLEVAYQGCKDNSVCYPPEKKSIPLVLSAFSEAQPGITEQKLEAESDSNLSVQDAITQRLKDSSLLFNVGAFLVFGLLLSLTPCVFPMIPILSGIIVGQGTQITAKRGFLVSLAYVSAMAMTYAVLGVIAGSFHFNLQAASQNIWVISAFSGVFVILALSMFGFFELQLPASIQSRLTSVSNQQRTGTLRGAATMGALSAVIVGPCVAPPLAGALLYISQTGNALLGGLALFAMGMGLGVPLLILGGSAGTLLPRAGAWMDTIKRIFGVVMLAVAIWFLERVIPAHFTLLLWALLLIVSAVYMGALDSLDKGASWARLWKGLGIAMLIYASVLVVGAAGGGHDVFAPLKGVVGVSAKQETNREFHFKRIKNLDELDREVAMASAKGKYVMLDFYADWCVTCIEMEEHTFPDERVREALKNVVLLQADVTATNEDDQALLTQFDLFGPPAILFFSDDGKERKSYRLIGFIDADQFLTHLQKVLSS